MRMQLCSLLAILALGFVNPMARAIDIYVLSNTSVGTLATNTDFGRIDSTTGAYTSIASLPGNIWNLAWSPTEGNFFVTANDDRTLRTLTTTGALSASLGLTNLSIYGTAYRPTDSKLYGYNFNSDATGTINTANGAWTTLNSNPGLSVSSPRGGRYTIMNDTIYMTAANSILGAGFFGTMGYTASSAFQQIVSDNLYINMNLANDGTTMYGILGNGIAGQQQVYTINTATGAATPGALITGNGLGTYFHGAAIVPVPEPSTYALAAIATGVMAAVARRRKARRA